MIITHNMMAINAGRMFGITNKSKAKTSEKLSSGYKINRAADDAAGLSISEKMRRQIRGLHQGAENIQDGIGYVQTADGALEEVTSILQRINELAVQSANGTNDELDRACIDDEVQSLKSELTRIFGTTTFNERRIWEPNDGFDITGQDEGAVPYRQLVRYDYEPAVTFYDTNNWIDVTNDNCGVVAYDNYHMHADEKNGVYISWKGYDGNEYKTTTISWDELKKKNYCFDMADYFGEIKPDNKLYDADGNPVFRHMIAFSVHERATMDQIVKSVDGRTISSSSYSDMIGAFENENGEKLKYDDVYIHSENLYYNAAYASNHNTGKDSSTSSNCLDFNKEDDSFLEPRSAGGALVQGNKRPDGSINPDGNMKGPNAVTVEDARKSKEGWEFSFYMDGIGKVTAKSNIVEYWAPSDTADDDYLEWWKWEGGWKGNKWVEHYRKAAVSRYLDGTLGDVMETLTGAKGTGTPGLLDKSNGGDANGGGYIDIWFDISAAEAFGLSDTDSDNKVGSFKLRINVSNDDTEESVLQKINNALNENTILDFYTPDGSMTYGESSFSRPYGNVEMVKTPVYSDEIPNEPIDVLPEEKHMCDFYVQAGAEAGQHIDIEYESLSLTALGLRSADVKTVDGASRSINAIKRALTIVNGQRADFGAYQNRLEHAYNINLNSEENTQYAESRIRDTDIAEEAVKNANFNILLQAGASMLSQANQQPNYALSLLQ